MYYNIKIKTLKGEYALESSEKDIIQREMDLYFASMYQASEEFKAGIKELDLSSKNQEINEKVQQLKNIRKNVIENDTSNSLDGFLSETIKEKNEPLSFVSFKNESVENKNQADFTFNYKNEYKNVKEEENSTQQPESVKPKAKKGEVFELPKNTLENIKISADTNKKIEAKPYRVNIPQKPSNDILEGISLADSEDQINKLFNNFIGQTLAIKNIGNNNNIGPQTQQPAEQNINNNAYADINLGTGSIQQETYNQINPQSQVNSENASSLNTFEEFTQQQNIEDIGKAPNIQQQKEISDFDKQIQQEAFEQYQQPLEPYQEYIEPYQEPVEQFEQPIKQADGQVNESFEQIQQAQEFIHKDDLSIEDKINTPSDNSTSVQKEEDVLNPDLVESSQTKSILKQPEQNIEIDYFTKDKPKKLERLNFVENTEISEKENLIKEEAKQQEVIYEQEETIKEPTDIVSKPQDNEPQVKEETNKPANEQAELETSVQEENDISKILNTVKNEVDSLDISTDEINGDLLAVFEESDIDIVEFSDERIESVKKDTENKEEASQDESNKNNFYKNIMNEYVPKQDEEVEYETIDVSDSIVHYESKNTLSEEKPLETFERKETIEGDNIITLNNNARSDREQQISEQVPQQPQQENIEPVQVNMPSQTPVGSLENKSSEANNTSVTDFKTYLSDFISEDILDKFLICAYYIKNILHQESFTIKFINSKLFPATGVIANMDVVNELVAKNYIAHLQSDTPKKIYSITYEGEQYFKENIQI